MSSRIMIDSSLLVEYTKATKITLLNDLLEDDSIECFINETIISEYLFQFLKISTGKAPKTLQESSKLPFVMQSVDSYTLLNLFKFLPSTSKLFELVPAFMEKYNLLPNDAIILATCKIHDINQLASHDSDFIIPCKAEGITLISEP